MFTLGVFMLWEKPCTTSEIDCGSFTNFLPSKPQVQNIWEGSQHQVLQRASGMSENVVSNVSILKVESDLTFSSIYLIISQSIQLLGY